MATLHAVYDTAGERVDSIAVLAPNDFWMFKMTPELEVIKHSAHVGSANAILHSINDDIDANTGILGDSGMAFLDAFHPAWWAEKPQALKKEWIQLMYEPLSGFYVIRPSVFPIQDAIYGFAVADILHVLQVHGNDILQYLIRNRVGSETVFARKNIGPFNPQSEVAL